MIGAAGTFAAPKKKKYSGLVYYVAKTAFDSKSERRLDEAEIAKLSEDELNVLYYGKTVTNKLGVIWAEEG